MADGASQTEATTSCSKTIIAYWFDRIKTPSTCALSDSKGATMKHLLIAGSVLAIYLANTFRAWYRLSHIPGPFWPSLSKYWMVSQSLKGRQPDAIKELNDKYGKLAQSPLVGFAC